MGKEGKSGLSEAPRVISICIKYLTQIDVASTRSQNSLPMGLRTTPLVPVCEQSDLYEPPALRSAI